MKTDLFVVMQWYSLHLSVSCWMLRWRYEENTCF